MSELNDDDLVYAVDPKTYTDKDIKRIKLRVAKKRGLASYATRKDALCGLYLESQARVKLLEEGAQLARQFSINLHNQFVEEFGEGVNVQR